MSTSEASVRQDEPLLRFLVQDTTKFLTYFSFLTEEETMSFRNSCQDKFFLFHRLSLSSPPLFLGFLFPPCQASSSFVFSSTPSSRSQSVNKERLEERTRERKEDDSSGECRESLFAPAAYGIGEEKNFLKTWLKRRGKREGRRRVLSSSSSFLHVVLEETAVTHVRCFRCTYT